MKIVLCGEIFSPNLGDGIIATGMRQLLSKAVAGVEIVPVDLAGRAQYPSLATETAPPRHRGLLSQVNSWARARHAWWRRKSGDLAWSRGGRQRLGRACVEALAGADGVVIGGGQLLMDNDLEFPRRVHEVCACATRAQVAVAVHGCGVGSRWSPAAVRLFGEALAQANVCWITTRDQESANLLVRHLKGRVQADEVCPDPGLWIGEALGLQPEGKTKTIALGVMDPVVMRRRAAGRLGPWPGMDWRVFWVRLAEDLIDSGWRVELFTNGALADEIFADKVATELVSPQLVRAPRQQCPTDLVQLLCRQEAVVSARLHGCVTAYALQIPHVGLVWDNKVRAFGTLTGRSRYFLAPDQEITPRLVKELVLQALAEGVDRRRLQELKNSALASTIRMCQHLQSRRSRPR